MDTQEWLFNLGGVGTIIAIIVAALRSARVRSFIGQLFQGDLKSAVATLQSVVEAQGESIEWLRTELTATRNELAEARLRLSATSDLAIENASLKVRVAELEAHVARLEEQLKAKRTRTRKEVTE